MVTVTDGSSGVEDTLLKLVDNESVSQEAFSGVDGEFSFTNVESVQYVVKMRLPQGYRGKKINENG